MQQSLALALVKFGGQLTDEVKRAAVQYQRDQAEMVELGLPTVCADPSDVDELVESLECESA